jgi:protein dithiol:quinone oxidoreductase
MRYGTIPWPWAALLAVGALLGHEQAQQWLGTDPSLASTGYRTVIATVGVMALALILLPRRRRIAYLLGAGACAGLLAWALWLQYGMGLEPCPLCQVQRLVVAVMGVLFLIAGIHGPGAIGAIVYAGLAFIVGASGAALAGWHIWIQAQPKGSIASCGMSLDYMLEVLPLSEVVGKVLKGSGEGAEQGWLLLALAIPSWTFVAFAAMTAAAIAIARND